MKTLKYIANTFRFLKGRSPGTNTNTEDNFQLSNKRVGFNLKRNAPPGKTTASLLSLLYAEENETLFI